MRLGLSPEQKKTQLGAAFYLQPQPSKMEVFLDPFVPLGGHGGAAGAIPSSIWAKAGMSCHPGPYVRVRYLAQGHPGGALRGVQAPPPTGTQKPRPNTAGNSCKTKQRQSKNDS